MTGDRITDLNNRLAGTEQRLDTRITELGRDVSARLDSQDLAHLSLSTDIAVIKAEVTDTTKKEDIARDSRRVAWEVKAILVAAVLGPIATLLMARLH
jgi:hypothetical protein